MINYWPLKYEAPDVRERAVAGLNAIRDLVREKMPARTLHDNLVLGTWNIRNFDDNRFGHGPRIKESMYFIAEVISAFDIVAVQEICRDLGPLKQIMRLLGPNYDFIVTDVGGQDGANRERLGFIYNTAKVRFQGMAGEMVLSWRDLIPHGEKQLQLARSPFGCEFQAGWFRFIFNTVHIYFGEESQTSDGYARRVAEIKKVAEQIVKWVDKEPGNYILVGDFNIDDMDDPTGTALTRKGFVNVKNNEGSNGDKTKFYDQITWLPKQGVVRQADSDRSHGVLDALKACMPRERFPAFQGAVADTVRGQIAKARAERDELAAKGKDTARKEQRIAELETLLTSPDKLEDYYFNTWRTFQVSDHLPLWVELEIDFSAEYLTRLKEMTGTQEKENVEIPM